MPRPTKLTARVIRDICKSIETTGVYLETACLYAGVERHLYKRWLKKSAEILHKVEAEGYVPTGRDEKLHLRFRRDVDQATAKRDMRRVLGIVKAGTDEKDRPADWRANAWLLERQSPEFYSAKHRLELAGAEDGAPIDVQGLTIKVVPAKEVPKELQRIPSPAGADQGKEVDDGDQDDQAGSAPQEGEAAAGGSHSRDTPVPE